MDNKKEWAKNKIDKINDVLFEMGEDNTVTYEDIDNATETEYSLWFQEIDIRICFSEFSWNIEIDNGESESLDHLL